MTVSALIFAGGTGKRMNTKTLPKQFLELHGKPIIIHTIEHFESHPEIKDIVVVCVDDWLDYCKDLLAKFNIKKVSQVVPGGETGQMSIFNGLEALREKYQGNNDYVLIHDGVRPLIDEETISKNIESVKKYGTAITVKPVIETVVQVDEEDIINNVIERSTCQTAVAPQSFLLSEIYSLHMRAQAEKLFDMTDSATLARYFGLPLHTVMGGSENIKITTPSDFYIFRAIYEARENAQIFG
ncbi:2-C-methyl-D-erythritol 4-phosphate cytidylyltransferase [Streptococcus gordonii]|jgi:2-C-methyl-D-erythritol 4-phosphate cytidylyltransferase|uniref:2-C-methyl-D-erythritol 4-phosphate cytidylyltransferase n=1 Tax=Streptococcus gordonii TaxID=1302 RepID=UPI000617C497|nr:2-C-methyl-D-erythritol 4-phosphate cytidylyltransferase [Streptococcus gordonii]ALD71566.1 2-C-methyl-D-erythritol 4-phosphate cytidylyltransferase [Streptococcus gordonii]AOS70347.1 2-C-methyl-D-erythritol 4-phosphate cytidylyltransferase [Streptococcus gordonii]MBZ2131980.1 2-C-methyl-D-erythritol 4-phosphate cytidylyltransferase [Streptococcus gordonii]MCY7131318.1 2-C-methyl-D-erythritol 4-phosphate cytidylyltransferase [Streptococcus gordonii]MCY7141690.1 2-C-methyl-D-erythritol 4-pho